MFLSCEADPVTVSIDTYHTWPGAAGGQRSQPLARLDTRAQCRVTGRMRCSVATHTTCNKFAGHLERERERARNWRRVRMQSEWPDSIRAAAQLGWSAFAGIETRLPRLRQVDVDATSFSSVHRKSSCTCSKDTSIRLSAAVSCRCPAARRRTTVPLFQSQLAQH